MGEGTILILLLSLTGLGLIGILVLAVIILKRIPKNSVSIEKVELVQIAEQQRQIADVVKAMTVTGKALDNAITRLSFTDSLNIELFAKASEESALAGLNASLKGRVGYGMVLTVNGIRLMPNGAIMTVSASRQGQEMLKNGQAVIVRHHKSGRYLAQLKDPQTGRVLENLKGVPINKALARLGALSTIAIGAAHIVAGSDISKRLKLVDSKLNLLLAYRHIDQVSTLERIYTAAKELASGPINREKCWELWRLRGELRELRFRWRRELQHHLLLIDNPQEAAWIKRMFTRQKTSDAQIQQKVTESELHIGLIEYSIRIDNILAVASGTQKEFQSSLAGELLELNDVANLLDKKSAYISKKYDNLSVDPTIDAMKSIASQYKELLTPISTDLSEQKALPENDESPPVVLRLED